MRCVNVLVLEFDGVVILVVVVHCGVEVTGDGHIEALAFVIARGATNSSAAIRSRTLAERSHAGNLGSLLGRGVSKCNTGTIVHILVLDVDGVVILAPPIDLGVGLDVGRVGAETLAIIVSRWASDGSTTSLGVGVETMLLLQNGLAMFDTSTRCGHTRSTNCAWAATASSATGIPPMKPFIIAVIESCCERMYALRGLKE